MENLLLVPKTELDLRGLVHMLRQLETEEQGVAILETYLHTFGELYRKAYIAKRRRDTFKKDPAQYEKALARNRAYIAANREAYNAKRRKHGVHR